MAKPDFAVRRHLLVSTAILGLALAVLSAPLTAAEQLTPKRLAELRTVVDAKISPDGKTVAYLLNVPRPLFQKDDGPAWQELHIVGPDGVSRPYVTGEVNVSNTKWPPSRDAISFLAKRGEDKHKALYLIPVSGGEARKILEHPTGIGSYSWSPDGKQVAFTATEELDKEKKELEEQGFSQQIYEEDWRPVRLWIAEIGDGGEADKPQPRMLDLDGSASAVEWSPAGDRIAVALAPTPLVDDSFMSRRVSIVHPESGEVSGEFTPPGKMGEFSWSPDGGHLALISSADRADPAAGRIQVLGASGQAVSHLFGDLEGHVAAIGWRDDQTIQYLADEGVTTSFGLIRRDGTGHETLIPASAGRVFLMFSAAKETRGVAFMETSPSHPAEVSLLRSGARTPERLTDSNPWLKEVELAKQEVVTYRAGDGLELQGVLIRPLNEKPGTRFPLIVAVHGGPESHIRNGWLTRYAYPGQIGAARGFATFYPNYRASTGRGVAFSKLDHGDPAGKEFDDLVDAVDHLVKIGLVDRGKVGITGGSYGGYASAWGATALSEHFAASVMFVGISDTISKVGTSDIPEELFEVHYRKRVWDDWQFFLERSPIYHAGKSRTATLILHGKEDPRVHPSQSLELHRHLKQRGKAPVRLVLYPGEGHGNRRAASRYDYNLRMLRWFEHYLRGEGGEPPPYELDYEKPEPQDEQSGKEAVETSAD